MAKLNQFVVMATVGFLVVGCDSTTNFGKSIVNLSSAPLKTKPNPIPAPSFPVTGLSPSPSPSTAPSSSPSPIPSPSQSVNPSPSGVPGPGNTWYIRPDGGTRYSAARITAGMSGQCNGRANAPYPGSGVNQPCAYNDFRFLWDDQTVGNSAWVIQGGDNVIIEGGPWRVGWDSNSGPGAGSTWCNGGGDNTKCFNPPIPAGSSGQHTKILGQNWGSCATGNVTNRTQLTQLFGGFGVNEVLNLTGTGYVDVECLEITRHSQCVMPVSWPRAINVMPAAAAGLCNRSNPGMDDFDYNGIMTDTGTHDILLQDMWIHGHAVSGLNGPIGGAINMVRDDISFNVMAGWNFDDGNDTADGPGSSINASYVTMTGNGCAGEYPINPAHTFPAVACYDLWSDGFGDSWSGQDTDMDSFTCDHCVQNYNTKDGFIGPHTHIKNLTITNSASYGNMGEQWKWGGSSVPGNLVFENNLAGGNCNRMSQPMAGAPASYNQYLSDFCRASGDVFSFGVSPGSNALLANNSVFAYTNVIFDIACSTGDGMCGSTNFTMRNNNVMSFVEQSCTVGGSCDGVRSSSLFWITDPTLIPNGDHNNYFNIRGGCPVGNSGVPGGTCVDPLTVGEPSSTLSNESLLDNFNFNLSNSSPAKGAGVQIPGLSHNYVGSAYSNPPNIGAY